MSDIERRDPDYRSRGTRTEDTFSLLDFVAVVTKRKWLIIAITAIVMIVTLAVLVASIVLPPTSPWNYSPNRFRPTVKILVQDTTPGSSLASMLNQSGLGGLSGLIGAGGGAKGTSADLAKALLAGNTIADAVTDQMGFVQKYHYVKFPKTFARSRFRKSLKVKYDDKSGILEIGYEDTDPVFAMQVVSAVGDRLQQEFRRLTLDKASSKRQYLEDSIAQAENDAAAESAQLLAFQNKYGIYDLPAQAQANISAVASLQAQLTSKQMELQLQRKYLPESDSRIVRLKDEIAQMQRQISDMKTGGKDALSPSVPLSTMASLSMQYMNIQRDLQIQQSVLGILKQQYEMAKIEELDTSRIFQVVENAEVPELRSSPNRPRAAIVGTIAGFFVSLLAAFVLEYLERARRDPVESPKLTAIMTSLGLRKKPSRK